jgi:hypothetical protein
MNTKTFSSCLILSATGFISAGALCGTDTGLAFPPVSPAAARFHDSFYKRRWWRWDSA